MPKKSSLVFLLLLNLVGCTSEESTSSIDVTTALNATHEEEFARADRVTALTFPHDHGPHESFRTEWWYVTAILDSPSGREFGFQYTLFRIATTAAEAGDNPWRSGQIYMGHMALSDVDRQTHVEDQRLVRGHPKLAGVHRSPFRAFIEDWELKSANFESFTFVGTSEQFEAELEFRPQKPIVLHGERGLSRKSADTASYYYSWPRMEAHGTIRSNNEEHRVTGTAWLDREWSSDLLGEELSGWDWFSLQLDNGRDMVMFQLRRKDGTVDDFGGACLIVEADGSYHTLQNADWSLQPTGHWGGYPVRWIVQVEDEEYAVAPAFNDQVMNTYVRYWEGLVHVKQNGNQVGRGYMELTGY